MTLQSIPKDIAPMNGFLIRLLVSAFGLWLASTIVPGLYIHGGGTLILAALLLGIVNAVIRPLIIVLTLPITIISLGIFLLVINAATLGLVASLLDNFSISGFFAAFFGALVVSITGWIASLYVGPKGQFEVLIVRKDKD